MMPYEKCIRKAGVIRELRVQKRVREQMIRPLSTLVDAFVRFPTRCRVSRVLLHVVDSLPRFSRFFASYQRIHGLLFLSSGAHVGETRLGQPARNNTSCQDAIINCNQCILTVGIHRSSDHDYCRNYFRGR